jgi:hypothetical protein
MPFVPLGMVTEVPSVQVTTAPPSIVVTEQEVPFVPFVPGCPAAPLLLEQPAVRSAASAAKGTDASAQLSFDMNHLVFLFLTIAGLDRLALMAASAC